MQPENDAALVDDDSDDDFDWEEVAVPLQGNAVNAHYMDDAVEEGPSVVKPNIEITIHARPKKDDTEKKKRQAQQAERLNRLNCHKVHTVILLGNAKVRNQWINDPLLHARMMSLVPMKLQNDLVIHKSRVPEAVKRGRMFESAIVRLVNWWCNFFTVIPTGHIKSRTYEEVQKQVVERAERIKDRKGKRRARDEDEFTDDEDGELIRSEKSLMKHALQRRGSRDTSAQLFTALCRALGIPARLVVSLQSVPWQANAGKAKSSPKKKVDVKGKGKAVPDEDEDDMEMEEVDIPNSPTVISKGKEKAFPGAGTRMNGSSASASPSPGKGKQKAPPVITLRKSKGRKLGSSADRPVKRDRSPDPLRSAPVFWTEVFSRADARWLPVDPVRGIVNNRKVFDPTATMNAPPHTKVENRMVYVLAVEEDGYARDVTARYAKEYGAKVSKLQQGGKGKKEWWERVMAMVRRPYRLNRDDLEDEELHVNQMTEQMPTTMTGFKNHPLYVLARHLRREEVIHPLVELGKFRGEPVYPRSSVVTLKTAENWMRQGRKVREGCQPMKWVKQHAVTVNKRRAVEMALADREDRIAEHGDQGEGFSSEKDIMQGLYAQNQTEFYVPDPVVDGKVPKNQFGNLDLYVPSMLPAGAVHIPYKGTWKIARQLGFDYAEAVTGFEFKKRRALPVITGIVIAAENEDALLEAYWEAEREAEEKRRTKRQEQVIKRWQRLVQGLRIRHRLQEQYADRTPKGFEISVEVEEDHPEAGGFLNTADAVVQPYTLPRNLHEVLKSPSPATATDRLPENHSMEQHKDVDVDEMATSGGLYPFDVDGNGQEQELEDSLEEVAIPPLSAGQATPSGVPKTMRELAELAEQEQMKITEDSADEAGQLPSTSTLPAASTPTRTPAAVNGRSTRNSASTPATASTSAKKVGTSKVTLKLPPRRNRKRARAGSTSDSDADADADAQPDTAVAQPSPAKRSRKAASASVPVPKSDRVLRTRAPKSTSKIEEEREMEKAFRRAIAE